MVRSCWLGLAAVSVTLAAAPKAAPEGRYRGEEIAVSAKLYLDKDSIRGLLGSELGPGVAVVEVTLTPLGEGGCKVFADDFYLKSDKDGQRSQPYSPAQIAGSSTLVISSTGGRGVMMGDDRGPVWGGIGGGRPRRIGSDGGAIGNAPSETTTTATVKTGGADKENPLLETLKKRALPEGEIKQTVTGLLYFPLDGKHKVKDLELQYRGQAGKFALRFKP
jgi:hypothetical protein